MKRSEMWFNLGSIAVDFVMILLSGIGAFYLRFELEEIRPIIYALSLAEYLKILVWISPIIISLLVLSGLYNLKGTRRFSSELVKIFWAVSSGLLVVVVLFFFNQTVFPSRLIILLTWAGSLVLISGGRMLLRVIQIRLLRQGVGLHRLAVMTDGDSNAVVKEIIARPELGFRIVAEISTKAQLPAIIEALETLRQTAGVDELLVVDPRCPSALNERLLAFCRDYGIKFNFVPDFFNTSRSNVGVETIAGIPIVVLKGTPLEGWGRVIKRLMDILIAVLGLILTSPILLLTALAIKLESQGPVFFHQPRARGLGQFECYKFRSMHFAMSEGTDSGDKLRAELEKQNARPGPFVKIKNDPRVTKVGRFIRQTKIDELPQLWHILRGQISLVGPRVHMVKEVDRFRNDYKRLFVLKPGATGLAQITQAADKPELSWEEEIRLDEFYIENWSVWLDVYIIIKTILILLGKKPKVDY